MKYARALMISVFVVPCLMLVTGCSGPPPQPENAVRPRELGSGDPAVEARRAQMMKAQSEENARRAVSEQTSLKLRAKKCGSIVNRAQSSGLITDIRSDGEYALVTASPRFLSLTMAQKQNLAMAISCDLTKGTNNCVTMSFLDMYSGRSLARVIGCRVIM